MHPLRLRGESADSQTMRSLAREHQKKIHWNLFFACIPLQMTLVVSHYAGYLQERSFPNLFWICLSAGEFLAEPPFRDDKGVSLNHPI